MSSLGNRLYTGEVEIDFVGRRKLWFTISAVLVAISIIALFYPGLNLGIDFKGGTIFQAKVTKAGVTEAQVRDRIGVAAQVVQLTGDNPPQLRVQTEALPQDQVAKIRTEIADLTGADQVDTDAIGSKWGGSVSRRALLALGVFLAAIVVYVSFRFEFKMAVAALVALLHDLIITAGIYALARFEVTPATVIALLTILGYSLYDTVVVFDKVKENTASISSLSRVTYSQLANRAVNQTAVRSLNTSLISLMPVAALLFVGAFLLGAETLEDLALALFVGIAVGTYSSMFVATPVLAAWKEREPRMQQIRARIARGETKGAGSPQVSRPARGSGQAAARNRRQGAGRTAVAEPEAMPMPALPPDPDDDYGDAPGGEEEAATAAANGTPQTQRQRPAGSGQRKGGSGQQQRRRSGGRQPSRPAKRRRR
jgi:preprotein translocase subunit SecF